MYYYYFFLVYPKQWILTRTLTFSPSTSCENEGPCHEQWQCHAPSTSCCSKGNAMPPVLPVAGKAMPCPQYVLLQPRPPVQLVTTKQGCPYSETVCKRHSFCTIENQTATVHTNFLEPPGTGIGHNTKCCRDIGSISRASVRHHARWGQGADGNGAGSGGQTETMPIRMVSVFSGQTTSTGHHRPTHLCFSRLNPITYTTLSFPWETWSIQSGCVPNPNVTHQCFFCRSLDIKPSIRIGQPFLMLSHKIPEHESLSCSIPYRGGGNRSGRKLAQKNFEGENNGRFSKFDRKKIGGVSYVKTIITRRRSAEFLNLVAKKSEGKFAAVPETQGVGIKTTGAWGHPPHTDSLLWNATWYQNNCNRISLRDLEEFSSPKKQCKKPPKMHAFSMCEGQNLVPWATPGQNNHWFRQCGIMQCSNAAAMRLAVVWLARQLFGCSGGGGQVGQSVHSSTLSLSSSWEDENKSGRC